LAAVIVSHHFAENSCEWLAYALSLTVCHSHKTTRAITRKFLQFNFLLIFFIRNNYNLVGRSIKCRTSYHSYLSTAN
jgi:hypothetical protein